MINEWDNLNERETHTALTQSRIELLLNYLSLNHFYDLFLFVLQHPIFNNFIQCLQEKVNLYFVGNFRNRLFCLILREARKQLRQFVRNLQFDSKPRVSFAINATISAIEIDKRAANAHTHSVRCIPSNELSLIASFDLSLESKYHFCVFCGIFSGEPIPTPLDFIICIDFNCFINFGVTVIRNTRTINSCELRTARAIKH